MTTKTVYLKDYRPFAFKIPKTFLSFELFETHTLVHNEMHLERQHSGDLHLYGDELQLENILENGQPLPKERYRFEGKDLIVMPTTDHFILTLTTKIFPDKNTALSGLYRSHQMFCTQCEAEGFRRITFFPDRPDVLSVYTAKISADRGLYPILLSNGNLTDAGTEENGRHWVVWEDPFPKPSYLFALVAGNLACCSDEFITRSGKTVALHLYVEPGNEDCCEHALISLKNAMRWDEEQFGREYDLSVYMIVAVSSFNMGAMENKGLNIFNARYILASKETATDEDFSGVESVVAHEYFHNWTGNRVTCRDWFQLSLKEGLTVYRDQEFSRDMNSRDVERIRQVRTLRNIQFPEDAGSMAHPVQPNSYQEISNFYTATIYNKGAEVIRMQRELLGKAGFRKGMDLYFSRHDGEAVTIQDFVAAMADSSGINLEQFKRWYHQAGTPRVKIAVTYANQCLTLACHQSCPPTPETQNKLPFHIPIRIAFFDQSGQELPVKNSLLELKEAEQAFQFENLNAQPYISLLRDFSAPIILETSLGEDNLFGLLRYETNGFAKWDAGQQLIRQMILRAYQGQDAAEPKRKLFTVLAEVLEDERLDPAIRSEILNTPTFEDLAGDIPFVDVEKLVLVRERFIIDLAQAINKQLTEKFNTCKAADGDAMDGKAIGKRKLRLQCLHLLLKAQEESWLATCDSLMKTAKTMTEHFAGFTGLIQSKSAQIREQASAEFYKKWSGDQLVLDKWFGGQAMVRREGVLETIKALLTHPDFDYKVPNRVRALLGAFTQNNPQFFHAIDGSGYQFLTDQLLILDPINPSISARLALPFTRGQRLDEPRQKLIQQQLQRLQKEKLSKDLAELVNKSLM